MTLSFDFSRYTVRLTMNSFFLLFSLIVFLTVQYGEMVQVVLGISYLIIIFFHFSRLLLEVVRYIADFSFC